MAELLRYDRWRELSESIKDDESTEVNYWRNGHIFHKYWRKDNGVLHRENGPAVIAYSLDGRIEREGWYIDGIEVTGHELEIMKARVKYEKSMREMGLEELL